VSDEAKPNPATVQPSLILMLPLADGMKREQAPVQPIQALLLPTAMGNDETTHPSHRSDTKANQQEKHPHRTTNSMMSTSANSALEQGNSEQLSIAAQSLSDWRNNLHSSQTSDT